MGSLPKKNYRLSYIKIYPEPLYKNFNYQNHSIPTNSKKHNYIHFLLEILKFQKDLIYPFSNKNKNYYKDLQDSISKIKNSKYSMLNYIISSFSSKYENDSPRNFLNFLQLQPVDLSSNHNFTLSEQIIL